MFSNHPTVEDFEGFMRGTSRSAASQARDTLILRHLLADCSSCRERLRAMRWDSRYLERLVQLATAGGFAEGSASETTTECDYGVAFTTAERVISALLAPEHRTAGVATPVSLAELEALPAEERIRRVTAGGPYADPTVIRSLIERSHDVRYQDADKMLELARLARLAADACSPDETDNALRLADLRARAWGQYGNALRVSGRPQEAEEALVTAERHRRAGTGDPLLHGWLVERKTPLAIFQGRFDVAIELCDEAAEIYRDLGEGHLLARTLVQRAIATLSAGKAEGAIRILNQAVSLIDHEEDPHLLLAACHNLIRCYIDLGRPDQALQIYSEIKELYEEFDDPLIQLRAVWQEGQLLRDLGHLPEAETILIRARKGYTEKKLAYEAALVSLDLATVYVKLGLVDKLKRTVLETVPIFHALRVELETLAALLQLQQVADQEQQALDLIRALSARIEPLRRHRFEES